MRTAPDPLVKLQQKSTTEGHSFKGLNASLVITGVIKPLYHTVEKHFHTVKYKTNVSVYFQYTSDYS